MADTKISALTEGEPASGDWFVFVDASDTSMAATGTDKKVDLTDYLGAFESVGYVRLGSGIPTFYNPNSAAWDDDAWWATKVSDNYAGFYYGWRNDDVDTSYGKLHGWADDDPSAGIVFARASGGAETYLRCEVTYQETAQVLASGVPGGTFQFTAGAYNGTNGGASLILDGIADQTTNLLQLRAGSADKFVVSKTGALTKLNGVVVPIADYTVTNPATDRTLDVSGDTTAQVAAVLGTLIADLITVGVLS